MAETGVEAHIGTFVSPASRIPGERTALSVAIPTYNRGAIVVDTVRRLLALDVPPAEILVVDQSREPEAELARMDAEGRIRWIRLPQPSIPKAMNRALLEARSPLVLFLDDDILPAGPFIDAHIAAHRQPEVWAVAGQILERGEEPAHYEGPPLGIEFRFNHDTGCFAGNAMAGNLSVKRERALAIGGFDENFVGVAYRFETDFAERLLKAGGRIWFEPAASLRHLKLSTGGLRAFGHHLSSPSPMHSVGDYYFAALNRRDFWRYAATRLRKNVVTRYHLTHPWMIPTKLIGEARGLLLARSLARGGRKLIER